MKLPARKPLPLIEPGAYPAVLIGAIGIGRQKSVYGVNDKIVLVWELPGQVTDRGETRTIMAYYNAVLSGGRKPSNLRKMLTSWLGPMSDDAVAEFDTRQILGRPAKLTIAVDTKDDGTERNIIAGVTKLVTQPPPQATRPVIDFSFGDKIPEDMPEYLQRLITAAENYDEAYGDSSSAAASDDDGELFP